MNVIVVDDYEKMSRLACRCLLHAQRTAIEEKGLFVLGLATGSTPSRKPGTGLYGELIRAYRAADIPEDAWAQTWTFNLDEYRGFPPEHEGSYHYFMWSRLFAHLPIPRNHVRILDGMAEDASAECRDFEAAIEQLGGIDWQLLGIGRNGHIGFAEPGRPAAERDARTQEVGLDPQTVADNTEKYGQDAVSERALSMGVGTVLEAKQIVLIAAGGNKALAIAGAVLGPMTKWLPASWLQEHPNCTFIVDPMAAGLLCELTGSGVERGHRCEVTSEAGLTHCVEARWA